MATSSGRALLLLTALAAGSAACDRAPSDRRPAPVVIAWSEEAGGRSRPVEPRGVAWGGFVAVAPDVTGIDAATSIDDEAMLANRTLSHGTGVALGDADGDGWVDVYVCRLDGPNVLYRNLGGWRFVATDSGAGLADRMSRGAVFADADGDGDADLFVSVHGAPNALLLNDGSGRFREAEAGFTGAYGTTTLALADVDADGDLDAYFANYKTAQADDLFSPEERATRRVAEEVEGEVRVRERYREHYAIERIGDRVRRWELADPDEFYLNDGAGGFSRVPLTGGTFRDAAGDAIEDAPRLWGLVARFFDMDDDLDPDLYVANDFGSPDGIWRNEGGTFRAFPDLAVRTTSASSMGVDFTDLEGDGDTDVLTTDMLALDAGRRRMQSPSVATPPNPVGSWDERTFSGRNAVQLNRGDGTYAEVGRMAGLEASEWTWGAMFLDIDLDGHEDLLVANGHRWDPLDGDTQDALGAGRLAVDWRRELEAFPPLELRNLAFRNRGDGTFDAAPEAWGFGREPDISHGLARADLDRDGDLDVVVTRLNREPLVLRNDSAAPRVALRLVGAAPNTAAVGARVTLERGADVPQVRQVSAGGMYLSGSDGLLAFAMRKGEPATVRVDWPSGARTSHEVRPNRVYELREPEGSAGFAATGEEPPTPEAAPPGHRGAADALRFEAVETGSVHRERTFDELARQPLVPLELSRGGPGVSWTDVDGDGDPDLLTAGAAGQAADLVRNDVGRLAPSRPFGPAAPGDQTTLLGTAGSEGRAVLAGVSNWEGLSPDALSGVPTLVRLGDSLVALLPGDFSAAGPLAQADVDRDGDLDVFVGGRALPGAYPLPASSRLVLSEPGGWREDAAQRETFRSIGLVSGAVFSDVDADGDPDLLLAVEWGPIRLFLNEGGRFTDATADWGLAAMTGRWNGIATGDLNGDGLPDVVATTWGLNSDRRASPGRPLVGAAADLDGNGQVEFLEAVGDPAGREIPLRDYRTLAGALPSLRRSFPTFESFSEATLADILAERDEPVYRVSAVTSRHTLLLNRGGGFEPTALPVEAQRAPAFGVVVADFDRDGHEDIYIAQNHFAAPPGVARDDAGRGAFLLGDGDGALRFVDAGAAGAPVYGDARGAAVADYDADGRWDLAVGQNGGPTALFRGAGGEPGLRVRLVGPPANPDAIGAAVRLVTGAGKGPLREIQAGSGYWSQNGATQVFGLAAPPASVEIRWPDGTATVHPVGPGARDLVLRQERAR